MNQAQAQKGFDIDAMNSNDDPVTHNVCVISDEDGNEVSGFIIVGKNSNEYQSVTQELRIEGIKRAARRKTTLDTSTDSGASVVARLVDENDRKKALAVVVGWYGMNSSGQPTKFDKTLVERMFTKFPTWQDKVLAALEDDANFMKA